MEPRPPQTIKPKLELNPGEQEIIRSLESFRFLTKRDKIFIVLIIRGFKSASAVSLPEYLHSPEGAEKDLEKIVQEAGLFFKPGPTITENMRGLKPGKICYVANSQEDLDLIVELWFGDHDKDPKVYRELGRMSGFPQTAIDIYDQFTGLEGEDRARMEKELTVSPDEKLKLPKDLWYFASLFYMSRVHKDAELEIAKNWAREIKSVAPSLYPFQNPENFYP